MRFSLFALCPLFFLPSSEPAISQIPTGFQQQAQSAVSAAKPFSVVNLTATAEWTAGSLHESGTAHLQANADGSTNVQLSLGQASRTEVQTKADSSRACTWTDGAGQSHAVRGPNCIVAIPWFAPGLFSQGPAGLPEMHATTDDGVVMKDDVAVHQVSHVLKLQGANSDLTNRLTRQSTVKVFHDTQTALPMSLEYFTHPDKNDLLDIPVRVVFSDYRSVSGVMLPFHIEKYVNRTLQLKLDVTNASIK